MEYVNGRLRPVGGGVLELHVDQGYWWNRPGLKVSHPESLCPQCKRLSEVLTAVMLRYRL